MWWGQGAPAAAVMGQLRSALTGYLLAGHPPAVVLEYLDRFATRVNGATLTASDGTFGGPDTLAILE